MNHVSFIFDGGAVMPKVSQEYLDNKRNAIVSAALKVCKSKPLYQITMKDIIRESGVSQGGIYRYFKSIDEILVEVINRSSSNIDNKKGSTVSLKPVKHRRKPQKFVRLFGKLYER